MPRLLVRGRIVSAPRTICGDNINNMQCTGSHTQAHFEQLDWNLRGDCPSTIVAPCDTRAVDPAAAHLDAADHAAITV